MLEENSYSGIVLALSVADEIEFWRHLQLECGLKEECQSVYAGC